MSSTFPFFFHEVTLALLFDNNNDRIRQTSVSDYNFRTTSVRHLPKMRKEEKEKMIELVYFNHHLERN